MSPQMQSSYTQKVAFLKIQMADAEAECRKIVVTLAGPPAPVMSFPKMFAGALSYPSVVGTTSNQTYGGSLPQKANLASSGYPGFAAGGLMAGAAAGLSTSAVAAPLSLSASTSSLYPSTASPLTSGVSTAYPQMGMNTTAFQ